LKNLHLARDVKSVAAAASSDNPAARRSAGASEAALINQVQIN
jgi:hypothetical protein